MAKSVPFYRPSIDNKEKAQLEEVLSSKTNKVEELEKAFTKYTGASFAVATSDGTSALHLAMLSINLKRGDKVLCSVNAYPSVPEVVRHFDAEPIFVDADESSYNINLDKLETILSDNQSKKLKAVIVSHIGGHPIDLERLYNIAKIYNIRVVEDASEALGGSYKGNKIGSTGADVTTFSFNPHLKGHVCNGGMMVTDDEDLVERAQLLRNHAMVTPDENLKYVYDVVDIGSKYDMSELDAAYSLAQLSKQDNAIKRQKTIAARYTKKLEGASHIILPEMQTEHTFSLYIIKVKKNRDSFARELLGKGVETGLHYIPLHLLTYYKSKYSLRVNDFPMALRNFQQVLSIPIFSDMSDSEVDYVCDTILDITKHWI
ncbi:DegT/DnrJ/EryC1/StrS aminotransferase family protein [Sulfurimonas sp. MAG313]|nr:DegT/DnrJ/EryC1/StrS aminotransferase family protein [Sulfurimonas sp. MAG313]MDF1879804.1 DegT/DnrJ/EryC1/StrS aminotransferase family protein [Sulfurimonas sp. MAG313]